MSDHHDSLNLGQVIVGNQALLAILGYGDILPLGRVLYVSGLVSKLISVRVITAQGFSIGFTDVSAKGNCWISMQTIIKASVSIGDLYRFEFVLNLHSIIWSHDIHNQPQFSSWDEMFTPYNLDLF